MAHNNRKIKGKKIFRPSALIDPKGITSPHATKTAESMKGECISLDFNRNLRFLDFKCLYETSVRI